MELRANTMAMFFVQQVEPSAIILWHTVPRDLQADLLHLAGAVQLGVPTVPDARFGLRPFLAID